MVETGFERIVEAVNANSPEHGQPSLLGRTLVWRAETANKTRTIQLTVTSRDGSTHIKLEENLMQAAGGVFGGMAGGAGVGLGLGVGLPVGLEVLGSVAFAVAAPIGIAALSFIGARWIYRSMVKKRKREMTNVFDKVVQQARASIDEATRKLERDVESPLLNDGRPAR
jgi:hypothetical protein